MTDERQPRGTAFGRRRPVMDGENPPNRILINRCSESQIDLLGDLGTSPGRIALFHLHDSVDQVCRWAFGPWLCSLLWREQQSVLSLNHGAMKTQKCRGFERDRNATKPSRPNPKRAKASD